MADSNKKEATFTESETKFIIAVIKNMEGNITTDFAAVATQTGYKDANGARTRWNQIRREKILTSDTIETPKKRKTKSTDEGGGNGETPKKRVRKSKAQKEAEAAAAAAAEAKDENGGFDEAVKKEIVEDTD